MESTETVQPTSSSASATARTAVRIRAHVPSTAHLIRRLCAVWKGPSSSGRSRQGEQVRYFHAMASRVRRWSAHRRPRTGSAGINGSIRSHIASVITNRTCISDQLINPSERHVLVVVAVAAADDATALAFQQLLADRWATSPAQHMTRDASEPGVRLRCTASRSAWPHWPKACHRQRSRTSVTNLRPDGHRPPAGVLPHCQQAPRRHPFAGQFFSHAATEATTLAITSTVAAKARAP